MAKDVEEALKKRDNRWFASDQMNAFVMWAAGRIRLSKTDTIDLAVTLLHKEMMARFPDECPPIDSEYEF